MKIVIIEPIDQLEIIGVGVDGSYVIEDSRYWWNLEVGDMIQVRSDERPGTECYLVTDVVPGDLGVYPRGLNLVTIRRPYLS